MAPTSFRRRGVSHAAFVVLLLVMLAGTAHALAPVLVGRDLHGSAAVEFAAARTPLAELRKSLTPAEQASAPWPTWGLTPQRTRYAAGSTLRPPYRTLWTLHAGALIELPPALAYGRLYFGTHAGTFIAASAATGAILWRRQLHHCMA